jgi:CHAD domain-containing protein
MSYAIERNEKTADGTRRIAREQIDKAISEIQSSEIDRHEKVHQVRKRCKKLRALVRLARPCMEETYRKENAWYRDSARALSDIRDAQALVECFEDLLEQYSETIPPENFAGLRRMLVRYRDRSAATETDVEQRLETCLDRMKQGHERVADWPLDVEGFDLLGKGLEKTYRRGRKAMPAAYAAGSVEAFHEWRKRVKYHWYHARMLKKTWVSPMSAYCKELKRLADYLGDDHDIAVLQQTLQENQEPFGSDEQIRAFCGLAAQRRKELQALARPVGARVYMEKPAKHADRLRCYWDAWNRFSPSVESV